jgi:hypothetical protein
MNQFKIGDKVKAVKDCVGDCFKKNETGTVISIDKYGANIQFDNHWKLYATFDEIELIEAEPNQSVPNPFPTFEEFHEWYRTEQGNMQGVYHYFAQFGKQPSQPISKPFPWIGEAIDDLKENLFGINTEQFETIYNYFAQFGVREVFPEVGKEYEGVKHITLETIRGELNYFDIGGYACHKIRPIQPSRLEQLMEKHPNLTDTEQTELLDLLLTQNKQNK